MQVRVLGAHNLESRQTKHTCFLIDGVMAIDAGSLASTLSADEQAGIGAVLLTHRHFDHVRDLPTIALATMESSGPISVYGLPETIDEVAPRLVDGVLYPDFTKRMTQDGPKVRFSTVEDSQDFRHGPYQLRAHSVPHSAPCIGYVVSGPDGRSFAYTGDCGGGLRPFFQDPWGPSTLFVEVTYGDGMVEQARTTSHLTPGLLAAELEEGIESGAAMPHIMVVHRDARHESDIEKELEAVSSKLEVRITLAVEDLVVEV